MARLSFKICFDFFTPYIPSKSPEASLTQGSFSLQPPPIPTTLRHTWGQFSSRYCQWHLTEVFCLLISFGGDPWNLVSCLAHATPGSPSLCFDVCRLMLISNHFMSIVLVCGHHLCPDGCVAPGVCLFCCACVHLLQHLDHLPVYCLPQQDLCQYRQPLCRCQNVWWVSAWVPSFPNPLLEALYIWFSA